SIAETDRRPSRRNSAPLPVYKSACLADDTYRGVSMKQIFVLLFLSATAAQVWAEAPTLFFQEAWNLNEEPVCPSGTQDSGPSKRVLPKLVKDWKTNGKIFLSETEILVGKSWGRKELTFFHHVCPDFPDLSGPTSIRMDPLINATKKTEPRILIEIRDTIWHELLHGYVDSIIDIVEETTPLLDKHAAENGPVLVHLHLVAIQQIIYEKLGLQSDAALVRDYYVKSGLTDYVRAWDLVQKDGPQAYVEELKKKK
ncbi:MAG: hypothetical protein ABL958_10930, partial [Bdellovibrionia bacterium]